MVRFLSKLILKICGWKEDGAFPEGKKFVVVAAPHTTAWDFIWGRLHYNSLGKSVKFMIKEKHLKFPFGVILKKLGAVPVYSNSKISLTEQMINEFNKREEFLLTITPEGTRKKVIRWKRGFYYIAKGANMPIALGYLDYEKKTMGVRKLFYPTDDVEADMKEILSFYKDIKGKYPECFSAE